MSCTNWNESLIGRLYGEIEAPDDEALAAHLASCESCRETLDELRGVRTLLRENEPVTPRVPRVVILRDRARFRPALLAASLLGAAVLAGAGAGAGYALGSGRRVATSPVTTTAPAVAAVPTEELVRREVERRLAALQEAQTIATDSNSGRTGREPSVDRPVTSKALGAELAKFERRLNSTRAAELEYVLDQIAASEFRVGTRLGKTNEALRSVALASNPYVNEQ
jgi:anti-sigma factor RsiW